MILETWKKETLKFLDNLKSEIKNDENLRNKCYGFSVIDGTLNLNPQLIFIGINSGAGNREPNLQINFETESCSYLDDYYRYPLRDQNFELLKKAGLKESEIITGFENSIVKTNLFYIDTISERDLKMFRKKDVDHISCYLTIELLKILKPKIVIMEGKLVSDMIVKECLGVNNYWDAISKNCFHYQKDLDIYFAGFARNNRNTLAYNQDNLAGKLKAFLSENSVM